ncbi:MAG TPA: GyrI-like domain-containing protein [Chloroflexia bacterium]|nr:GyrI-like domain-containing protein [Chloroflexia bacterium]
MIIRPPAIEDRPAQPYAGIRTQVPMAELPTVIPQLLGQVFAGLARRGVPPDGPPFCRFHVIDMAGQMDVEMGVPVAAPLADGEGLAAGQLPAGRYAVLTYVDVARGIEANKALLDWGAAQGLHWDQRETPAGDAFGGRYESFLTGPADSPDPAHWQTEVAIRLADSSPRP